MHFRGPIQRQTLSPTILAVVLAAVAGLVVTASAFAQPAAQPLPPPVDLLPPVIAPVPVPPPPAPSWPLRDAAALLAAIQEVRAEGLDPKDYEPATLAAAIAGGEGTGLNDTATRLFTWLVEDLRDGRTPMDARVQWFAVDPDRDLNPTTLVLARALEKHDVAGELAALAPLHPDYLALKQALAAARAGGETAVIRANMDRWRWLARDMGNQYLLTNVPEYMLRLTVNNRVITSYRTVVGKPGKTATPQLAETVEGVIFNPTWTVPQSIVKGEGLGAKVLGNPGWARAAGYKGIKDPLTGFVTVVQQPGKANSLGLMKLDMPNPHAIFVHDSPAKTLFAAPARAFSHGCIRAERASELGMLMAMLGGGLTKDEGVAHTLSGVYTKVPMTKTFPIYITYFTMARDVTGGLRTFADIYDRDTPVLASLNAPRQLHTDQRQSNEDVIEIVDDLGAV